MSPEIGTISTARESQNEFTLIDSLDRSNPVSLPFGGDPSTIPSASPVPLLSQSLVRLISSLSPLATSSTGPFGSPVFRACPAASYILLNSHILPTWGACFFPLAFLSGVVGSCLLLWLVETKIPPQTEPRYQRGRESNTLSEKYKEHGFVYDHM